MRVAIPQLQPGDRFEPRGRLYYTVWSKPFRLGADEVVVPVQYADGGLGERVFSVLDELDVERPDA